MRVLHTCALLLAVSTTSAFAQSATPAPSAPDTTTASVDYSALKDALSTQNKSLTDDVVARRAIVKRNTELLKEAQKLDAANKKLAAEKQKLTDENANLEKQRTTLESSRTDTTTVATK